MRTATARGSRASEATGSIPPLCPADYYEGKPMNQELDQILEAIPLEVEQAFERWWNDSSSSAGLLCPDEEAIVYAAFAAGAEAAPLMSQWRMVALICAERLCLMGRSHYAYQAFEKAGIPSPRLCEREATGQDLPAKKMIVHKKGKP